MEQGTTERKLRDNQTKRNEFVLQGVAIYINTGAQTTTTSNAFRQQEPCQRWNMAGVFLTRAIY